MAWRWRASASSRASPTSSLDGERRWTGLCVCLSTHMNGALSFSDVCARSEAGISI